jgi:iron complex transport system substrate-binding protein
MRIASLISAATEMLFALDLSPQVVAVSHECDWPPECQTLPRVTRSNINAQSASGVIDNQVRSLLENGRPLYEIDTQRLAELLPTLIVTQAQCDVCAVRYADVIEAVRGDSHLGSAQILTLNPQSLSDVFRDIVRLGEATGKSAQAARVVMRLQQRVEAVRRRTAGIAARPRVAMIEWTDPLMLAGNWVPELVEIAGGDCSITRHGAHSRIYSWDELIQFDPQAIVVCPCGFDEHRAREEAASLAKHPHWHRLSAVKSGQVFALDGNAYFNRPSPRLVDSVERLAELLHGSVTHSALERG